jgi:hypothetical protein
MIRSWVPNNFQLEGSADRDYYTPFDVAIGLHKPVKVDLLASLFEYPHRWEGYDCTGSKQPQPAQGISRITVMESGAILRNGSTKRDIIRRNVVEELVVDCRAIKSAQHARNVFRELARLPPVRRKLSEPVANTDVEGYPTLTVPLDDGPILQAWLESVSPISYGVSTLTVTRMS